MLKRKQYELSLWQTSLINNNKTEEKILILSSHSMDFNGAAANIKLTRKTNGSNSLEFELPTKVLNKNTGEMEENYFTNKIFNEQKVKLKLQECSGVEWFEFYIKEIVKKRAFQGHTLLIKCQDSNIDELSRNGYGITFNNELSNSVEEIGTFVETILENSQWEYAPELNICDFSEKNLERLYKIPLSQFNSNIKIKRINYEVPNRKVLNVFSNKERNLLISDDLSRKEELFWNAGEPEKSIQFTKEELILNTNIEDYIYVPYSQLEYVYNGSNIKEKNNHLLLQPINKLETDYLQVFYFRDGVNFNSDNEPDDYKTHYILEIKDLPSMEFYSEGFFSIESDEEIVNMVNKVVISDRTEFNKELNTFATVYNTKPKDIKELIKDDDFLNLTDEELNKFKICSIKKTQFILPKLAKNLIQNGINFQDVGGWAAKEKDSNNELKVALNENKESRLIMNSEYDLYQEKSSFINFGMVSQNYILKKDTVYAFTLDAEDGVIEVIIMISSGGLDSNGNYKLTGIPVMFSFYETGSTVLIKSNIDIKNPYFVIRTGNQKIEIKNIEFYEAYTKGRDLNELSPFERTGLPLSLDQNWVFEGSNTEIVRNYNPTYLIKENDVFESKIFSYNSYFLQALKKEEELFPIFKINNYEEILDFPEQEYEIITAELSMPKCGFYKNFKCEKTNGNCYFEFKGECPYRFEAERHPRKIRTLEQSKSNRFNLVQECSKKFDVFPVFKIEHERNGEIKQENNKDIKKIFFMKEKNLENHYGFTYNKNLNNIEQTIVSNEITTKLYVEDLDSSIMKDGICTIKTAEDNISKDSNLFNFDYYISKGLLNKAEVDGDFYGTYDKIGYLKSIGTLNSNYDKLSNQIVLLQKELIELKSETDVLILSIDTSLEELKKLKMSLSNYVDNTSSSVYKNIVEKIETQENILIGAVGVLFLKNNSYYDIVEQIIKTPITPLEFWNIIETTTTWENYKKELSKYKKVGKIGFYNELKNQNEKLLKSRSVILKEINNLNLNIFKKYESFIKEGIWSDNNFTSNNAYYYGALNVLKNSSYPKVEYQFTVENIGVLNGFEEYEFQIGEITNVFDKELFGNKKMFVIVSEIEENISYPKETKIKVQNYKTKISNIFETINAVVQSAQLNEQTYKRAAALNPNQTLNQNILQNTLSNNEFDLISTPKNNLKINQTGTEGANNINSTIKYKQNGEGTFFSEDGGESWNNAIGPKGINASYLKFGQIDVNKISLIDSGYLYFNWDKTGITAYKDPMLFDDLTERSQKALKDYARFNKYGLSLVENGQTRLRAGYEFKRDEDGEKITKDSKVGFFLYNRNGEVIFSTNTVENNRDDSARLSLAGEMFVADKIATIEPENWSYYINGTTAQRLEDLAFNKMSNFLEYEYGNAILNSVNQNTLEIFSDFYSNPSNLSLNSPQIFNITLGLVPYDILTVSITQKPIWNINIGATYLKRTILKFSTFLSENGETSGESTELFLVREAGTWYYYNSTQVTMKIKGDDGIPIMEKLLSPLPSVPQKPYLIFNEVDSIYSSITPSGPNVYEFNNGNGVYFYYNEEYYLPEDSEVSEDEDIGIFLNNQITNNFPAERRPQGYAERIFCCAKKDTIGYKNIFTILNTGELFIGGKIIENASSGTLSELDNFIKIDEAEQDVISLSADGIKIGGKNIEEGIYEKLSGQITALQTIVENSGLIKHNHSLSGVPVGPTKNGSLLTANGQLQGISAYFIDQNSGAYYSSRITLEQFKLLLDNMEFKIKEGSYSGETGSGAGVVSGGEPQGYYVEGE